jgi:hypothetical protein
LGRGRGIQSPLRAFCALEMDSVSRMLQGEARVGPTRRRSARTLAGAVFAQSLRVERSGGRERARSAGELENQCRVDSTSLVVMVPNCSSR